MQKNWFMLFFLIVFVPACDDEGKSSTFDRLDQNNTVSEPPRNPLEPLNTLQMVYIGVSSCQYCTSEKAVEDLKTIREGLSRVAKYNEREAWFTGIAADEDPLKGIEHLLETGDYNEINAGAYYFNLGHMKYIWGEGDFTGPASVPQLIINQSTYRIEPSGMTIGNAFREENVLKRYTGEKDIEELAQKFREKNERELSEYLGL